MLANMPAARQVDLWLAQPQGLDDGAELWVDGLGCGMTLSWDRQTDETEDWYDRFMLYLYMGPDRSIAAAHSLATRLAKGAAHGQLPSWKRAARRHQWQARAAAFDAELYRVTLAKETTPEEAHGEASSSDGADEEHLQMVTELLHQVYGVLRHADLLSLSREEARRLLPTFRLFFRDLLRFHQSERAQLVAGSEGHEYAALNADALVAYLRDQGGIQLVARDLVRLAESLSDASSWQPLRDLLAQLYPDETSARRISAQAQLDNRRISFSGRAVDDWHAILTEAMYMGLMDDLIDAVQREYGTNPKLARVVQRYRHARNLALRKPNKKRTQGGGSEGTGNAGVPRRDQG